MNTWSSVIKAMWSQDNKAELKCKGGKIVKSKNSDLKIYMQENCYCLLKHWLKTIKYIFLNAVKRIIASINFNCRKKNFCRKTLPTLNQCRRMYYNYSWLQLRWVQTAVRIFLHSILNMVIMGYMCVFVWCTWAYKTIQHYLSSQFQFCAWFKEDKRLALVSRNWWK